MTLLGISLLMMSSHKRDDSIIMKYLLVFINLYKFLLFFLLDYIKALYVKALPFQDNGPTAKRQHLKITDGSLLALGV